LAFGTALEPAVFGPVAFATGRTALEGLHTEIDGELPGGAFLYVTTQRKNLLVEITVIFITALWGRDGKQDWSDDSPGDYCAIFISVGSVE
jgi:hypothetical protein